MLLPVYLENVKDFLLVTKTPNSIHIQLKRFSIKPNHDNHLTYEISIRVQLNSIIATQERIQQTGYYSEVENCRSGLQHHLGHQHI